MPTHLKKSMVNMVSASPMIDSIEPMIVRVLATVSATCESGGALVFCVWFVNTV